MTARDLDLGENRTKEQWGWNWSTAKTALEWLFRSGRVDVAGRTSQFERIYDIPERVIPRASIDQCQPWFSASKDEKVLLEAESHRELVRRAARALGVATARCLADYFRTAAAPTRAAITSLVDSGELIEVEVDGVKDKTWIWHEAAKPRTMHASALVSPFDSLVFLRSRLASFFHTDYTIGLYTPAKQRTYGYYVYLFFLGDGVAARVDLKADRAKSRLLVQSAWLEEGAEPVGVCKELTEELRRLATWLGLTEVEVAPKGTLASTLATFWAA